MSWRRRDVLLPALCAGAAGRLFPQAGVWLRPDSPSSPLVWGRAGGIVFGLAGEGGMPGPRGLIRVGVWNAAKGQAELVNFIAVEPVAFGHGSRQSRMGFSELEPSGSDGMQGKRFTTPDFRGTVDSLPARPWPVERLSVRIEVEPFAVNGAHVYVVASVYADRPEELALAVHHHEDSAPIEEHTLTATMGNYERLRWLWLKDRVVDSRKLYAGFSGTGFIDKENYPRDEMFLYGDGDALAIATANEPDPAAVQIQERPFWTYKPVKLTQYWRVPARHIQPDLRVKVNGRATYYGSAIPIPGGVAFENFELRQRYVPGQVFCFGLTRREPWEWRPPVSRLPAAPEDK